MSQVLAVAEAPLEPPGKPEGRLKRSFDRNWYAWAMVLPTVLVLGVLVMYPLVQGIFQSFTDLTESNAQDVICTKTLGGGEECKDNPNSSEFVGLKNYVDLLTGAARQLLAPVHQHPGVDAWRAWRCTTGSGSASPSCSTGRCAGAGSTACCSSCRGRCPASWPPSGGSSCSTHASASSTRLLVNVGLDPVEWFNHRWTALFAAICTNVWLGVPFMMVAILGGLQSINGDLYEAAEMDGATPWQRFRNVTLPGLRPVSSTVILLGTIWTFNMFPIIYFVTGGEPAGQSEILVTGAYRAAFEGVRNYSLAATYGVLILSILMVFAAVYRRTLKAQGEVF